MIGAQFASVLNSVNLSVNLLNMPGKFLLRNFPLSNIWPIKFSNLIAVILHNIVSFSGLKFCQTELSCLLAKPNNF